MYLGHYDGKTVRIISTDGVKFEGFVNDYVFPDDNENEKESIILHCNDGRWIEFYEADISSIRII